MQEIRDKYGRTFRTLRVSLSNHCNLGCVYCVAGEKDLQEHNVSAKNGYLLPGDLLIIIGRLHRRLGLDTIRLTGGEPLLYPALAELIKGIRSIGIPHIRMTTNGFLLERMAASLKDAGLESVNVSLDAVDEEIFFRMSRRHSAERVMRGIDAALAAGLKVKINAVIMKGLNDGQVIPLLEFAFSRGIVVRYLELMAMGHLHDQVGQYLVSQAELLKTIGARYKMISQGRAGSATASYWKTEEGPVFGIIANESEPFCGDCDRLRLDSLGNVYGCLSSNHPIALDKGESEEVWSEKLQRALEQKQAIRFVGSDLSMLDIGG